jgi:hypothetical protein
MALNPSNVPESLVSLLSWAEKWAIGDDFEREAAIERARVEELKALVHCIDDIDDDDLFGWLSGDESFSAHPSVEYLAITNLTMAIDSAALRLKQGK